MIMRHVLQRIRAISYLPRAPGVHRLSHRTLLAPLSQTFHTSHITFSKPAATSQPLPSEENQELLLKAIREAQSHPHFTKNDRMVIGFTCKVCSHRSYKSMSKKAYTTGVVMMKCDGCKSTHLIADHLGWYDSQKPPGTIEEILKGKGENVVRVEPDTTMKIRVKGAKDEKNAESENITVDLSSGMYEFLPKKL